MPELETWRQRMLRGIPAAHLILATPRARAMIDRFSQPLVADAVGESLADLRQRILRAADQDDLPPIDWTPEGLAEWTARHLEQKLSPHLRRVVNATGVILHTNLGRALLAPAAVRHVAAIAGHYNNLELDLATGERGSRYAHVEDVLRDLTGAEAAMVVNNNAGAVLLALAATARGREVIVSRGELVEIGGSFRVPDVMEQSGAILREVGTTNKTHLRDYERAIGPETVALLKVHRSNFRIQGFTAEVELAELADLARRRGLAVLYDQGSGVFVDLARYGLSPEPTIQDSIRAGADLVTFSGDKLLGGPQAGMIVGKRELVECCRRHPLTRALRIDKLTLAALEATLRIYLDEPRALREIPTLRMLLMPLDEVERRARALAATLHEAVGELAAIGAMPGHSQAGGGSLPTENIPTWLVSVAPRTHPVQEVESRLRQADPPVMVRVQKEQLLLDSRTLQDGEDVLVAAALARALA